MARNKTTTAVTEEQYVKHIALVTSANTLKAVIDMIMKQSQTYTKEKAELLRHLDNVLGSTIADDDALINEMLTGLNTSIDDVVNSSKQLKFDLNKITLSVIEVPNTKTEDDVNEQQQ